MSRSPLPTPRPAPVAAPFVSRPTFFDCLLMLCGIGFSLWLARLIGFQPQRTPETPAQIPASALELVPSLLFLPLGVVLLWPIFYSTQRVVGRPAGLSGGEWLWGCSWLLAVGLTGWIIWQEYGTPPEALQLAAVKGQLFAGYAVTVLALAAVAALLLLIDLMGRWRQPWTHHLSLVLALWPVLPLAALYFWKIDLK